MIGARPPGSAVMARSIVEAVLGGRDLAGQILRYGIAGGTAVATHLAVLAALVELFACPATLASALGFACATPVNYVLQHRFVFGSSRRHDVALMRYLTVTFTTLGLNTAIFWLLYSGLGLYYLLAQIGTIAIVVPLNFAANRTFTFRSPRPAAAAATKRGRPPRALG